MRKYNLLVLPLSLVVAFTPLLSLAAEGPSIQDFLEGTLVDIINTVIRFLIAVATLIFVGSIVYYISLGGQTEKLQEARRFIVFSIIGLVLIMTVWGFVNIIVTSLNLDSDNIPKPPQIETP